jgi:hypothetical protein
MKKVSIKVHSGLGNQIFMIFCLLSYYIDNCDDYVIYYEEDETKKYYWDTFFKKINNKKSQQKLKNEKIYSEPYFHYKKIPKYDFDIVLNGFFQSDKFFKHNINKIKNIIDLDKQISNIKNEYSEYFKRKTIAVHFRIGDYYNLQNMHPIQKVEYYIKSLNMLIEKGLNIKEYDILYFCQESDNIIVNEYIKIMNIYIDNLNFVKISDSIPDWKQLLLMNSVKHFIIGNSTFSWMGAYLSNSYEKKEAIVICPRLWFGDYYNYHQLQDLRPEDWIIIEN